MQSMSTSYIYVYDIDIYTTVSVTVISAEIEYLNSSIFLQKGWIRPSLQSAS